MGQVATAIPEKIYFKIGEVCDLVGVQAHVLRYWETEFPQLSPQKNRSGQRSYRRKDVEMSFRIKELLYDEMFTIAGARKKLQFETRPEAPKLKIVRPEHQEMLEKNLNEGSLRLFDDELPDEDTEVVSPSQSLAPEQLDALRTLADHLLELREMLKLNPSSETIINLENHIV